MRMSPKSRRLGFYLITILAAGNIVYALIHLYLFLGPCGGLLVYYPMCNAYFAVPPLSTGGTALVVAPTAVVLWLIYVFLRAKSHALDDKMK